MTMYAGLTAPTGKIADRDRNRWLWPLGLIVPLLPLIGLSLYTSSGWIGHLYMVPFVVFVMIPIQDMIFGIDNSNLAQEVMESIADSRYYRRLVELYVPLQYLSYIVAVYWIAREQRSAAEVIGMAIAVGVVAGIAINAAHEMGHKSDSFRQWLSRISLAQSGYGHFFVEHNRGHHRNVSTPEDPASGRYGESFWAFFPRTVVYSITSAWSIEADRLERRGRPSWHWTNKNLQSWSMSVALFGATIIYAGFQIVGFIAIQAVVGFFLLEVVNYIEHYGLLRQKLANGRYERCRPVHSWNSNYRVTNLFLYQLQRHSDHHAHPTRPYQILRNRDDAPNLPAGYATMILLAVVPPLWFRVMNPRVESIYAGDLTKANTTARARRKLELNKLSHR